MIEAFLVFALAIGLGWPLGRYLAAVMPRYPELAGLAHLINTRVLPTYTRMKPGSGA